MEADERERLIELCQQAAQELETTRLLGCLRQINDLLEHRRHGVGDAPEDSGAPQGEGDGRGAA
jgi:hypothetical protein